MLKRLLKRKWKKQLRSMARGRRWQKSPQRNR